MIDVLGNLFDASGFMPRWNCGFWSAELGWTHIISDILIWLAYMTIPVVLVYFAHRRRKDIPFPWMFWMFGAFIISCGFTHFMEVVMFYNPVYRLSAVVKIITALASWGTVIALIPTTPIALSLQSPRELEQEIAERKRVEEELRNREKQLNAAQRLANLGSWEWDISRNRITWSNELYHIFGLDADTYVPGYEAYLERVHPEDRERVRNAIQESSRTGEPFSHQNRVVRPDGSIRTLHSQGEVVTDDSGAPVRMLGICQDITERTQMEESVRESERKFRSLLELAPYGIVISDRDGKIELVNAQIEKMFGYDRDELIGQAVEVFIPVRFGETHLSHRAAYATDPVLRMGADLELSARRKDGNEVPVDISLSPVEVNGRLLFMSIIIDISHHRQMTQALARQAENLKRANAELEQFAYVASHDLQEPLRKIQTFSDVLKEAIPDHILGEEERGFLDRMQGAAHRMQVLIGDMLKLSRVARWGQPVELVDLNEVVEEVLSDLEISIQKADARVERERLPTIEAEPTQMRQLMQNLISNAIKFHKPAERPVIKIYGKSLEPGASSLPEGVQGEAYCQVFVEDNGIGFEEKYADQVFTIFRRLHGREEYEGTGIGLAICKKIVERHNGEITARSTPGAGATFIVTLPVRQPEKDADNQSALLSSSKGN